ncbi:MAG: hypothetical protein JXN10_03605, partial [Clostridia bacterium]|nr:hypothetical protein [Clostridia bacterium]
KNTFIPGRAASWWCSLEDILWPEKHIVDKIKRRSEEFAAANIDTAINFGFHVRFDFSNYFSQLHGYYAKVCEELHNNGIRFMDHYSCNHVQRPRNEEEFNKVHKNHRHHILLFHDPIAAEFAQYEGHFFNDICEIDIRNGKRGYSTNYQLEVFCHNNPEFLDMHTKYLKRLLRDVPMDGIEVDDMCDYAGLATCGCDYCRDRFKRDYGHEIPEFSDKNFWGVTEGKNEYSWGNYNNPVFRDWLKMKSDSVADHLAIVKKTVGDIPLMTCCSSSGPIILNALALNLEKMSSSLDFIVLENCGISISSTDWLRMDAEALHQKDIAKKRGNVPAIALSYSIYEDSAYLGWALSRFWGVGNWSSTLNQRLEKDPEDAREIQDLVNDYNAWEIENSDLNYMSGKDHIEIRLVNNSYCRDNGWRDSKGIEHWDKVRNWSKSLVKSNVGYRFVRADELSDKEALLSEHTPLICDGLGCMSLLQFDAIKALLDSDGTVFMSLPFGTHDEKGFQREVPLSQLLERGNYKNLYITESSTDGNPFDTLISNGIFTPSIIQQKGNKQWVARLRFHDDEFAIHLMNSELEPVPHPYLKNNAGTPILEGIKTNKGDFVICYRISIDDMDFCSLELLSPEIPSEKRKVRFSKINDNSIEITLDLSDIGIYAVVHGKK